MRTIICPFRISATQKHITDVTNRIHALCQLFLSPHGLHRMANGRGGERFFRSFAPAGSVPATRPRHEAATGRPSPNGGP